MFRVVAAHNGVDGAVRVDVPHPLRQHLRLGAANGGVEGAQLAVDVALAVGVLVDDRQLPHAGAGQGLHRPAPNAPQSHHAYVAGGELSQGGGAQEHLIAQKGFTHVSILPKKPAPQSAEPVFLMQLVCQET